MDNECARASLLKIRSAIESKYSCFLGQIRVPEKAKKLILNAETEFELREFYDMDHILLKYILALELCYLTALSDLLILHKLISPNLFRFKYKAKIGSEAYSTSQRKISAFGDINSIRDATGLLLKLDPILNRVECNAYSHLSKTFVGFAYSNKLVELRNSIVHPSNPTIHDSKSIDKLRASLLRNNFEIIRKMFAP